MGFGRSNTAKNINISDMNDEYAIFAWWKPYIMMISGAAITFFSAALIRIFMWISFTYFDKAPQDMANLWSWGVVIFGAVATFMIYKFYKRRGEQGNEVLIRFHPTITAILGIVWIVIALQENVGSWMFGELTLFFGVFFAAFAMITWSARRWSFKNFQNNTPDVVNPYGEIGLGDTTVAMGASEIPGTDGKRVRIKPKLGVTLKDFQDRVDKLAQMFGVSLNRIRVWGDAKDPNTIFVDIFDDEPFAKVAEWAGPFLPGKSIAEPIEFATYDMGERPQLYIGGRNGGSSQHFLTAGMSGAGKSYGWQSIYGTILNRQEVSVLYADPAKGLQTVKPLLSGISWFANGVEESLEMFKGVERAIKARGTWLANQDLENWVPGCGLNLLILHIEEAARFMSDPEVSKEDLARLTRIIQEARSAGIVVVYSLQRITHDCIPTSLRYNLGGILCFGLKTASDTKLVMGDTPALPHTLKDKFPGTFYFDAKGIDQDKLGFQLKTDKLDRRILQQAVIEGAQYRTPMDKTTEAALGDSYLSYKKNSSFTDMNSQYEKYEEPTAEYENVNSHNEESVKSNRSQNFTSDSESEKAKLWDFIVSQKNVNEEFTFTEIQKPYTEKYGVGKGTVYKRMQAWVDEDRLGMNGKMYFIK